MAIYSSNIIRYLIIIAFLLLTYLSQSAFAGLNNLAIKWETMQEVKGLSPNPNAVLTGDNNLIIIGESYSDKGYGYWIAKYDFSGKQLFKKDYGVEDGLSDFNIQSIANEENDSFMVVGNEFSHGYKLWLRKFNKTGTQVLKKTYTFSKSISPGSIIRSDDGNFIITGSEEFKNVIIIKIDNQGNQLWEKIFKTELVESIALSTNTKNKGILTISVTGELSKFGTGESNIKITKYDSQGLRIGGVAFPGRIVGQPGSVISSNINDTFYLSYDSSVIPKGNVCVPRNIGENIIYLMKFNSDLETIWNISIGTKMGLIFPPIINRIGDTLILAGRGNFTMEGIEPPWIYLFDLDGHKVGELKLKNHMDFNPNSIVVNENDIFLIGTEMPMGENDSSKVIIFNIGLK
jgi:hypothetical protein